MAWFSDYTEAPVVILESDSSETYLWMFVSPTETPPKWKHKITRAKKQIKCLTYEAAIAAQTFYQNQPNTSAHVRRVDDTGQYAVEIDEESHEFTEETA